MYRKILTFFCSENSDIVIGTSKTVKECVLSRWSHLNRVEHNLNKILQMFPECLSCDVSDGQCLVIQQVLQLAS